MTELKWSYEGRAKDREVRRAITQQHGEMQLAYTHDVALFVYVCVCNVFVNFRWHVDRS